MKILAISNYFPSHPGGIEIVAQNLVSRWRRKHNVRWAACDVPTHPYECKNDDIPLPATNFTEDRLGFPYPIPDGSSIITIVRQVKWCDVVHIHDCLYAANLIAFLAAQFFKKPILVTQHVGLVPYKETYKDLMQRFAYKTIGKLVLRWSNRIIFINNSVKKWFETKMGLSKTYLIQNGVDHQVFYPSTLGEKNLIRSSLGFSRDDIVLLFIGRFTQKKGIDMVKMTAAMRPNHQWVIVGDGEIDVSKWKLPNIKVFHHQPQTSLRAFYIAADLLVLPSRGEGFPLTVQEALSCGTPAAVSEEVALSLPDAPLIGLDISSAQNLLRTLDAVLEKPEILKTISERSKEYAKQWDWETVADQYEQHFFCLINDIE